MKRAIRVLVALALVMTGSYSISAEELTSGEIAAEQIESPGWPEAPDELGGEDVRESADDYLPSVASGHWEEQVTGHQWVCNCGACFLTNQQQTNINLRQN